MSHEEGRKLVEQYGGTGLKIGPIKTWAFAQMLAKIAHSYAVAYMGLGAFNPLLLDLIFGRDKALTHLIGSDVELDEIPPPIQHGHYLDLNREFVVEGRTFIVVTIRLFANLGTPRYYVVVGER